MVKDQLSWKCARIVIKDTPCRILQNTVPRKSSKNIKAVIRLSQPKRLSQRKNMRMKLGLPKSSQKSKRQSTSVLSLRKNPLIPNRKSYTKMYTYRRITHLLSIERLTNVYNRITTIAHG